MEAVKESIYEGCERMDARHIEEMKEIMINSYL
jgi:hypothetical protein